MKTSSQAQMTQETNKSRPHSTSISKPTSQALSPSQQTQLSNKSTLTFQKPENLDSSFAHYRPAKGLFIGCKKLLQGNIYLVFLQPTSFHPFSAICKICKDFWYTLKPIHDKGFSANLVGCPEATLANFCTNRCNPHSFVGQGWLWNTPKPLGGKGLGCNHVAKKSLPKPSNGCNPHSLVDK